MGNCIYVIKPATKQGQQPKRCGAPTIALTSYCGTHQTFSGKGELTLVGPSAGDFVLETGNGPTEEEPPEDDRKR